MKAYQVPQQQVHTQQPNAPSQYDETQLQGKIYTV